MADVCTCSGLCLFVTFIFTLHMNALRVVIRGKPSDEAVLCTKDKTFEMKAADTSNCLLVTPSLHLPCPQGTSHTSTHTHM